MEWRRRISLSLVDGLCDVVAYVVVAWLLDRGDDLEEAHLALSGMFDPLCAVVVCTVEASSLDRGDGLKEAVSRSQWCCTLTVLPKGGHRRSSIPWPWR